MKKLLTILGAIAFTASAGSTLVACGTSNSSTKLKNDIDWSSLDGKTVLTLPDGEKISADHYMEKSQKLTDYLLNKVNQMVANKYVENYNQTNIAISGSTQNLGLLDADRSYALQGAKDINAYEQEINDFNYASLSKNFYQTYVQSLMQPIDTKVFDETSKPYLLNPMRFNGDTNSRAYSIWFKDASGNYNRWTTKREMANVDLGRTLLPTAEQLASNDTDEFVLLKDTKGDFPTGDSNSLFANTDKITNQNLADIAGKDKQFAIADSNITGQKALTYRFQAYLEDQDANSMINPLVMEYAKNNMYKVQSAPTKGAEPYEAATNKSLYVDTSSTFVKGIQDWDWSNNQKIKSTYKMVWSITVKDKAAANKINDTLNKTDGGLLNLSAHNGLSDNSFSAFKTDETISAVYKALGITDNATNLAKKGTDPVFGMSGYQGIVKDGKVVDGGSLDIDDDAAKKISASEGFGIVKNNASTSGNGVYNFKSKTGNTQDFIIVMPIYMMDLLRSGTAAAPSDAPIKDANTLNNIATDQWIELNPQSKDADWDSTKFAGATFTSAKEWDKKDPKALPTENSYMTVDGKTYVFFTNGTTNSISVKTKDGKTITINPEKADASKPDVSGYGISGTFSTADKESKAISLNGQNIKYAIRLGTDSSNPKSYETSWLSSNHNEQIVQDIADLATNKKTDLMNTLLALEAKDDSLVSETKSIVYRNYISLDDIIYKPLYDSLKDYLKEDDTIEPSD